MTNAQALAGWIKANGYSKKSFADMIGVARNTVSLYCLGKSKPSAPKALLIQRLTAGAVDKDTW